MFYWNISQNIKFFFIVSIAYLCSLNSFGKDSVCSIEGLERRPSLEARDYLVKNCSAKILQDAILYELKNTEKVKDKSSLKGKQACEGNGKVLLTKKATTGLSQKRKFFVSQTALVWCAKVLNKYQYKGHIDLDNLDVTKVKHDPKANTIYIPLLAKVKNRANLTLVYGKKKKGLITVKYGDDWNQVQEFIKVLQEPRRPTSSEQTLCSQVSRESKGKASCSITYHNSNLLPEQTFSYLRKKDKVTVRIRLSLRKPLKVLDPGAGKSGAGFLQAENGRFVLKKIKTEELELLKQLMRGANGRKNLASHFANNPMSLLNKIYGAYTLTISGVQAHYILMADAKNGLVRKCQSKKTRDLAYDLKGSSRDPKEMNWSNVFIGSLIGKTSIRNIKGQVRTGVNGDFNDVEGGKLPSSICEKYKRAIKADIELLAAYNIIDYSLLYTRCMDRSVKERELSLIDYLIPYGAKKKVESLVRKGKFDNYGDKVIEFFSNACSTKG